VFSRFFETLGAKSIVNTYVFCASEAHNHRIYDVFLPLVTKIAVFTVFSWPVPSKNTSIYAIFSMLQEILFHAKGTKTLYTTVFWVCS